MSYLAVRSRESAGSFSKAQALLLLPLAWWTLTLGSGASTWCFLDYVNLAFHEAGHVFLSFAGSTLHYLGGTIGQLLVPAALATYFLIKEERPFAAAVCCWWLGESLINVSIYMADARTLALPLVGGGDHDWNELFYRFGMLSESSVNATAAATHLLGALVMLLGLSWATLFFLPPAKLWWIDYYLIQRWPWIGRALPIIPEAPAGARGRME
jgi:hypothetical protein